MDLLKTKYFMKNPTKSTLKKKGFRYDLECSTKEYDCFTYSFPVDYYNKTPVLVCKVRVYMDNGEVDIDVINCGDGSIYPAWYQRNSRIFQSHKNYIEKIDNTINDELNKLHIKKDRSGNL